MQVKPDRANYHPGGERQRQGRGIINDRDEIIYDYQGQPIRLPAERWRHIIDPAGAHPYMVAMRAELYETLKDPDVIIRSTRFPDMVRIYHKWFVDIAVGNKWVRVVVMFFDYGDAFVTTAYAEYEIIFGGEIWRKQGE